MHSDIEMVKEKILPILREYGAQRAALFGSFIRGQVRKKSDIDILVQLDEKVSLFEFVRLKLKLEETLNRKVDLVEYETIKPLLRERILNEQVVIL
ncbi:MAG TPA: nucleotidyltransferase family protein [bacterium]|jgi:predicted nucleotidyltransferase